ncbi:hypothetical protein BGX28_008422 [Mortierella sp. GBA30]|nr:hypothetical protein BGX28_008422 [Mortierella sp. GBA30]
MDRYSLRSLPSIPSLGSRRNRRYFLILLIVAICSFLAFSFSLNRSHSRQWYNINAPFGLDSTNKPITEKNQRYRGNTKAANIEIPASTWTCTDDSLSYAERDTSKIKRSRQCVVENLCVDRKGAFIRSSGLFLKNIPKVNLMSSDQQADVFWQPRVERFWSKTIKAHYVNDTLFVHGLYSPYHFSHWLYNGMMPLYSTMKRFGATKDSWTLRDARFSYDDITRQGGWEMDHFFYSGKELVLAQDEIATDFQTLPPADAPICFKRAVVGLGSQCALDYCENNIPAEVYQAFRDEIADHYWKTPKTWQKHLATSQQNIDKEQTPGVKKSDESTLRCLDLARYYNFQGVGLGHSLEEHESSTRVGQRFPDVADAEQDYRNFFVNSNSNNNSSITDSKAEKRKLVVGIIQREKSRRLLNDQDLINSLVEAGFRVKWMSFDHGCGLAETAYLLRDVNVLISPHGNAIGASIFMPTYNPVATVISIETSRYQEAWFKYTSTVLGQRFISSVCGPTLYLDEATKERCPLYKDLDAGLKLVDYLPLVLGVPSSMVKTDEEKKAMSSEEREKMIADQRAYVRESPTAQALADEELELLIGSESPSTMYQKYGDIIWSFEANFWKGIPRYVDVPRLVRFIDGLQKDLEREKLEDVMDPRLVNTYRHFVDYVRKGEACGVDSCDSILVRNVAGEDSAFGVHSIDNVDRWGQPTEERENLLQRLTDLKHWKFEDSVDSTAPEIPGTTECEESEDALETSEEDVAETANHAFVRGKIHGLLTAAAALMQEKRLAIHKRTIELIADNMEDSKFDETDPDYKENHAKEQNVLVKRFRQRKADLAKERAKLDKCFPLQRL